MQWIERNLVPLSASVINICRLGSSSVSWCDFTKVSLSPLPISFVSSSGGLVSSSTKFSHVSSNFQHPKCQRYLEESFSLCHCNGTTFRSICVEACPYRLFFPPHLLCRMNAKIKAWNDDLVKTTLNTQIFVPKDYQPPSYTSPYSLRKDTTADEVVSFWDFNSKVLILYSFLSSHSDPKDYLSNLSSSYDELIESFVTVTLNLLCAPHICSLKKILLVSTSTSPPTKRPTFYEVSSR